MHIFLFTTSGCHLCDKAASVVWSLPPEKSPQLTFVEIADSDELIERYGVRIPVISKAASIEKSSLEDELGWPFDQSELLTFLNVG